jgi:hypothetical protein
VGAVELRWRISVKADDVPDPTGSASYTHARDFTALEDPEEDELTFDQVLGVLLSLIGHVVTIGVAAAEGTPPLTLTSVGSFDRATDISSAGGQTHMRRFSSPLGDPPPGKTVPPHFFLHRHAFRNARLEDGVLWVQLGPLQLMVETTI